MTEIELLKQIDKKLDRVLSTNKTWLSVKDLSKYISISESKIREMISKNTIPFQKIDGTIRFSRKKIDIWILTGNLNPTKSQRDRVIQYLD